MLRSLSAALAPAIVVVALVVSATGLSSTLDRVRPLAWWQRCINELVGLRSSHIPYPHNYRHTAGVDAAAIELFADLYTGHNHLPRLQHPVSGHWHAKVPNSRNTLVYASEKAEVPLGYWSYEFYLWKGKKPSRRFQFSALTSEPILPSPQIPSEELGQPYIRTTQRPGQFELFNWELVLFRQPAGVEWKIPHVGGVYTPTNLYSRNYLLRPLVEIQPHHQVLVLGGGAGHDGAVVAATIGAKVDITDIDPFAVMNAKLTAIATDVTDLVTVWQSNLFEKITRRYDTILFPGPLPVSNPIYADTGMHDAGGSVLKGFLQGVDDHLTDKGKAYTYSGIPPEVYCGSLVPELNPRLNCKQVDGFFDYGDVIFVYQLGRK